MRQIVLLALILCLIGCNFSNHVDNKSITDDNIESKEAMDLSFKEFVDKLPFRQLPLRLSCGLPDGPGSDNLRISNFEKFKDIIPTGFDNIYGVINTHDNFKVIIYGQVGDDIYPTLFTYSKNGKIIDSLFLILNACGNADETQIPHSFATIDKDLSITLVDTNRFIHYPDNENNYILDSIVVTRINYQIDKKGLIIKQ
jgi:hypothetical protein